MPRNAIQAVKTVFQLALVVVVLCVAARADISFSGSGSSGVLSAPSETWSFNSDGGAATTGYLNDWGSPGVGAGVVPSGESVDVYGMEITFTGGGTIDAASIATGNGAGCVGSTYGGTTFCTISPTDIWEATLVGPDSIDFLAQNASYYLTPGQEYFVNIFFDGATPTSFTGEWLTEYSPTPTVTPEPSSLYLLGSGLFGLAMLVFWKARANRLVLHS
jgi:hypothetical protein